MFANEKEALANEVFDYVHSHASGDTGVDDVLGLGHFEFLAEKLDFTLEDLSLYAFAYHLGCNHSEARFDIKRVEFVEGLMACINNVSSVSKEDGFAAAFRALRAAVVATNSRIRADAKEREAFSTFLYMWCLKSNKASDRTIIATELWELYYTTHSVSNEAAVFTGYTRFNHLGDWISFVKSADFAASFRVSLDLWNQLRVFASVNSYDSHNPDDAWPLAIDAFVEWYKDTAAGATKPKAH